MRVAILLTGALRTFRKTMPYLKRNLVEPTGATVFACLEGDSAEEAWIRAELGSALRGITWFDKNNAAWTATRDRLLTKMPIPIPWKDYVGHRSGSIIEYHQLQDAYSLMFNVEQSDHVNYDYIIRCRTDTIFHVPVDFAWLRWDDAEVERRLACIPAGPRQWPVFMATLLNEQAAAAAETITYEYRDTDADRPPTDLTDVAAVRRYLREGRYILSFRVNLLYIVRRDLFGLIPALSGHYGMMRTRHSDDYWFNAENQFQAACHISGMTIYNYDTLAEADSVYNFSQERYFAADGSALNPAHVYCLVRH